MMSFRSIVELWPTREAMAADLGASPWVVSKWWQRDNIPAEWWVALLSQSKVSDAGVTADDLMRLVAKDEARA